MCRRKVCLLDVIVIKARCDNRNANLIAQGFVNNGTKDDVCFRINVFGDKIGGIVNLLNAQVFVAGNREKYAGGTINGTLQKTA